ncbi:Glycerol dehydrogenase, iron-containing ADH family [Evansella caseinilytica]|uniref:Glycerol dehydrogenase, iron-containing ADH family n=1 Tax=Evansella caseinilytica TaxID=1503961 RepID=A0A1H3RC83_9BACI|nr:Glycerol dehydrogenase, iron-containing ADH family [Evansella caseinilytica]
MDIIPVQGAPNFYQCHEGVLERLPELIKQHRLSRGLLIHGEKSWRAAKKFFSTLEINTTNIQYRGECTFAEVARIGELAASDGADFIIGVGGGKVMDIAKAVASETGRPYILVPTLASNCAAWTPLSVFYDQDGNFLKYTVFPTAALVVLVEPRMIIDSPPEYLIAGIGDTIAKWYEADVLIRGLEAKPLAVEIAHQSARLCRDVLLAEGKAAAAALRKKTVTSSFLRVIETIIMAGGMVGGYGEKYGRIAGAHSIHNGLTYVNETHSRLHGDKVAYGILVQLALENNFDEIMQLLPVYRELNLPASLQELGITSGIEDAIDIIAERAVKQGESIHFMNVSTKELVVAAIRELERAVADAEAVSSDLNLASSQCEAKVPFQAALLQLDIAFGNREENFHRVEEKIRKATEQHVDVIVLPELWSTGYDLTRLDEIADKEAAETTAFISRLAKQYSVNIVAGSVARQTETGVTNTMLVFRRNGELVKEYSKAHLFRLMKEDKYLAEGNSDGLFTLDGHPCAGVICYDIRFPEWIRTHMLDDTKVLFVVAEWPKPRIDHWRALLVSRAIENQCYVVACNRAGEDPDNVFGGHSIIIGPWGEIVAEAGEDETTLFGELDLAQVDEVRQTIPIFSDRRKELYKL